MKRKPFVGKYGEQEVKGILLPNSNNIYFATPKLELKFASFIASKAAINSLTNEKKITIRMWKENGRN
ncbi:hypothetical protein [Pontimicrobium sp. SW4]|uniref:Uncharacterized protein n=1 Tax=Pontimicrobium sp. SW4 TaxID=3153519 RepID=A0AAU7BVT3_9FLAO